MSVGEFILSPDHTEFRSIVREFCQKRLAPESASVDAAGVFPERSYERLVESGLHAVSIPKSFGGEGADALASAIAVEEVARACASSSTILTSNNLVITPLLKFGSQTLQETYLPDVAAGKLLMAYALSEREAGSDISAIRAVATKCDAGWILNGVKTWVTSAGRAGATIVFAATSEKGADGHVSAFIVEVGDDGLTYGAPEVKMGLRGSVTRDVVLQDCFVGEDRLVGDVGQGLKIALGTLDHTRISIGAQAVGIAQGALDVAIAYAKDRVQFGKPISEFQGVQFMLADMACKIDAARLLVYSAACKSSATASDLTYFGAAAKCFASDVAMEVTTDAVQLLGGNGYTNGFPVERMMRDAKITQIYEGTNQIQRIVMARSILAGRVHAG